MKFNWFCRPWWPPVWPISVTESFAALLLECGVDAQQYGIQNAAVDHRPDMVLSLGGDGTVLETAALEAVEGIPVLGINTGRLGFLAHLPLQGASEAMASIMTGSYIVESRNRLEIEFLGMDVDLGRYALNEVTVHRRDVASMIRISVHRDGTFVNRYWADGLIVSTATGSTAYSLSCGGPIVHPDSNAIVLNPIAPHNLNDRPLVIPAEGTLEIHAEGRDDHLMLTLDSRSHKVKAPLGSRCAPRAGRFCWFNCRAWTSLKPFEENCTLEWTAAKALPVRHTKTPLVLVNAGPEGHELLDPSPLSHLRPGIPWAGFCAAKI